MAAGGQQGAGAARPAGETLRVRVLAQQAVGQEPGPAALAHPGRAMDEQGMGQAPGGALGLEPAPGLGVPGQPWRGLSHGR